MSKYPFLEVCVGFGAFFVLLSVAIAVLHLAGAA